MKNRILISLTFVLLALGFIQSQDIPDVSIEMLQQERHPLEENADAAYLIHNCEVEYIFGNRGNIVVKYKYHDRIKFYNDEAEDYAQFELSMYRNGSTKVKVDKIKAYTYNLEGGEIIEEKLDKKQIFEEKTSENYRKKKFAMPSVKPGSIIDVKYEISSPFWQVIPKWHFQNKIPTDLSIYEVKIPEFFRMNNTSTGIANLSVTRDNYGGRINGQKTTMTAINVSSIKTDAYVLNMEDYRAGVKYELESITSPSTGKTTYFTNTWNQIAHDYMKSKSFGKIISKKYKELEPVVFQAETQPIEERAKFIYDYVRDNYEWNEYYGITAEDGLKDVVKEKSGSIGEINLLLLNLFDKTSIKAFPVLTKERSDGLLNSFSPSITELNYLIAAIQVGEDYIFLDATSKYIPYGLLPIRATNQSGILVHPNSGYPITISNPNRYLKQSMNQVKVDIDNVAIVGTGQYKLTDFAATDFRIKIDEKEKDEIEGEEDDDEEEDAEDDEEDDEEESIEDEITHTETLNLENLDKSVVVKFDLINHSSVKKIGDEIFIDAILTEGIKENPFTDETREYPIFYPKIPNYKSVLTIAIPDGYHVKSVPEKASLGLPDKAGVFNYEAKNNANGLMIYYTFKLNKDVFLPDEYPALKHLYKLMIDKQNEKIILTSASEEVSTTGND